LRNENSKDFMNKMRVDKSSMDEEPLYAFSAVGGEVTGGEGK
jgi:hypothetical protein